MCADYLRGLSLTHIQTDDGNWPLEVSLCTEPARPLCYVYHTSLTIFQAEDYKRGLQSKTIHDPTSISICAASKQIMEVDTPVEKPLLEQVLDSIPEEQRTIIAARLTEMCKHVDDAKIAQKTAEEVAASAQSELEKARKEVLFNAHFHYKNGTMLVSLI